MTQPDDEIYVPCVAFFLATIGLILSLVANFFCGYANSSVVFTEQVDDEQVVTKPYSWRTGIWSFEDHDLFYVVSDKQIMLVRYYYCVPWNGQTKVDQDTNWTAAQVFTILSVVFGGLVGFAACFISCTDSYATRRTVTLIGLTYLLIILFQGFTFLYFASNACHNGTGRANHGNQEFKLEWDGCSRGTGANCSIASMVFYFVASFMILSSAVSCNNNNHSNSSTSASTRRQEDEEMQEEQEPRQEK